MQVSSYFAPKLLRQIRINVILFSVLLAVGSSVVAAPLRHEYRFDTNVVSVDDETVSGLTAGALPRTWVQGQAEIPFDHVTLLVPRGSQVKSLRASRHGESVLLNDVTLPEATSRTTDDGKIVNPPNDSGPTKAMRAEHVAEVLGMGRLHGYQLLTIRVFPLRYDKQARAVLASGSIALDLELENSNDPQPLTRERYRPDQEHDVRTMLRKLVDNPLAISSYDRPQGVRVTAASRGFKPTEAPSLEGSPVDYLVITSQALEANFQVLVDWKTKRGIPAVVRTTEWIEANYRNGSDLQETIRNFIKDAYSKWGVEYVLLGGSHQVIPVRYGFSNFGPPTESSIPTDMYFACLDGNWNADGDELWGEAAIDSMNLVDDTDLYAEVYVGRLPVTTSTDADRVISKIMTYENPSITDYQDDVLLLSEVLFPVDWVPNENVTMDGSVFSEDIDNHIYACATIERLYQNYMAYPGSSLLSHAATIAAMNEGPGIVNHVGHGFRYNMSVGDRSLLNSDAMALTNGDKRFLLYMLNCTAAAFDFPCLAEAFLLAPGGAVGVLGSSRAAFALPSFNYNNAFFEALYADSVATVGKTFVQSRLPFTPNALNDTSDHYTHFLYNMLADPEMTVHTCSLLTTAVTFPSTVPLGETQVQINVTAGGSPRSGARVCLQKDVEEYVWGLTDANGDVTLTYVAESAGTVELTVSAQNITTFEGVLTVDASTGPYVHVTGMTLDDDVVGTSSGNGDGAMDSGEMIELSVDFRNDGSATANGVTGVLRSLSPQLSVLDSVYTLGTVAVSGTSNTTALRILADKNTPDGTVVQLEFETTDGSNTWTDVIAKVMLAPVLEVTFLSIDDSAPGGNGDGVIQAGETFDVIPSIKNYGGGAVDGLTATLLTADPDLVLIDNDATFGGIAKNTEQVALDPFRVTENSLDDNAMLLFTLDSFNRVATWGINFRVPVIPAAPQLDASEAADVVVATWTPSIDVDLAGYHVYRAESATPPSWTRVTKDRTSRVAYFRDQGLAGSTEYFYYVTAVDSSGNESSASSIMSISTQPPQLSGWPILVGEVSSSPAAVGDITGDGSKEIVAGFEFLYAWDWQGVELLDGDQDPQTWGVYVDEINIITGAVVLADITSDPGFEVLAGVWADKNKVFVVDGQGGVVDGWPQAPDSTSSPAGYWGSLSAADVDGDGLAEVFAPGKNGNLYAWNGDGSPLGVSATFKASLGNWTRCSPSFADIDGDPFREIIYGAPDGTLHAWNADGSNVSGFPVSLGSVCVSSTAIGDVNNDGRLDIVMLTDGSANGAIHVIDSSDGTELPGWPIAISNINAAVSPSPALADFNFDGFLEVVVANNNVVVSQSGVSVYNHAGVLQPGWPQLTESHTSESSPIVVDVSGDGIPDILFGTEGDKIFGWDKDGNVLSGFPLSVGDFVRSTPFADDVDDDGDIDIVLAGWDRNVHIWDFPAAYVANAAQWPTFQHDASRSGHWNHQATTPTDVEDGSSGDDLAAIPALPLLAQNKPNPFNPMTTIAYGIPAKDGNAEVALTIYDVHGRVVRTLVRGRQAPGSYNAIWDGRSDRGQRVQSGVFFYRLQIGSTSLTRKMTVLK